MDEVSDEGKNLLLSISSDLEFEDDVVEFRCTACHAIAFDHYISECEHVYCKKCQIEITAKNDYQCPKCQNPIFLLGNKSKELEKKLYKAYAKCPYRKHGCKAQSPLKEMIFHIQRCDYRATAMTQSNLPQVQMQQMFETMMKMMEGKFAQLANAQTFNERSTQQNFQKPKGLVTPQPTERQIYESVEVEDLRSKVAKLENLLNMQAQASQYKEPISNLKPHTPESSEMDKLIKKIADLEHKLDARENSSSDSTKSTQYSKMPPETKFELSNQDETEKLRREVEFYKLQSQRQTRSEEQYTTVPSQPKNDSYNPEVENMRRELEFYKLQAQKPSRPEEQFRNVQYQNSPLSSNQMDYNSNDEVAQNPIQNSRFTGIPGKEYNILLLGQTGVGKSTFINAFCNYLQFNNLEEATNETPKALIASKFTIPDENYETRTVSFGKDDNEWTTGGKSATQKCKAYVFPVDNFALRIIDTPGIGDTRGIDQDRANLDGMLRFISSFEELYAICILLKPNESRLTPSFAFCIKQLLCHLHQKASKNIVFVFTNSRSTFYRPGDTVTPLKAILKEVEQQEPHPMIPFNKSNIFCLDNESFRFLIALQNGIKFKENDFKNFEQSWLKSVEESSRMIKYIVEGDAGHGLKPHLVIETLTINEARQTIVSLSQPLADIAKTLECNIQVLNQQKKDIKNCKNDKTDLEKVLYMPKVSLNVLEMDKPCTVCTGEKCREPFKVGEFTSYHYPQKCHEPCGLKEVPKEEVGLEALRYCWAMGGTDTCRLCKCNYTKHLHIWYNTELVETKVVDPTIKAQLATKEGAIGAANKVIRDLEDEIHKCEENQKKLSKYTAKLAIYLKQNAMVVRNDSFKEHLNQIIENEKSLQKAGSNNNSVIKGLQKMMENYEREKEILDRALSTSSNISPVSIEEVNRIIKELGEMENVGISFKDAIKAQKSFLASATSKFKKWLWN